MQEEQETRGQIGIERRGHETVHLRGACRRAHACALHPHTCAPDLRGWRHNSRFANCCTAASWQHLNSRRVRARTRVKGHTSDASKHLVEQRAIQAHARDRGQMQPARRAQGSTKGCRANGCAHTVANRDSTNRCRRQVVCPAARETCMPRLHSCLTTLHSPVPTPRCERPVPECE